VIIAISLAGMFLLLRSSASSDKASSGKESLETCQKQKKAGKMIWENLSHQFFSSF
jgi:hypothetical protein